MNIKKLIKEETKKRILIEGFFSKVLDYVTKTTNDNRVKFVEKQIEKEDPELAQSIHRIKKAKEKLESQLEAKMEEPEYAEKMEKYLNLFK